jgi:hypothetical protein
MSPLLGTLTESVLLIVGFCLMPLAGFWLWRRFEKPARAKRNELRVSLMFLLFVVGPQVNWRLMDLRDRQWAATAGDWAWLTSLAALAVLHLWRLPKLWRAARTERLAANAAGESSAPSLRGQLLLILLPVVGLAVVGMVSLARDRAAVEAAARREAEDVARELAGKLSRAWPGNLYEVEAGAHAWQTSLPVRLANLSPPSPENVAVTAHMTERARRHFRCPPEGAFPVVARFAVDGALLDPLPYPAVPRATVEPGTLAAPAAEAWQQVEVAELASGNAETIRAAAQRLRGMASTPGQGLLAEFLVLRYAPETNFQTVAQLLQLGLRAVMDRVESPQGLPMALVALAEAARRAPQAALDKSWTSLLGDLVLVQPSSLTPWALSLGDEMAKRSSNPGQAALLGEIRARWQGAERVRGLAASLVSATRLTPSLQQNLWLTNRDAGWLALVQPWRSVTYMTTNGVTLALTNRETHVRFFQADTLELAAFNGLHTVAWVNGQERLTPPRLPTGMSLSLELEGHLLNVPADRPVQDTPAPVLAEAAGEFRLEGEWAVDEQGKPLRVDFWPSRPKFTVRVHLADSAALFVAQRRQQWLFGGMILVTAGVAGLGVADESRLSPAARAQRGEVELRRQRLARAADALGKPAPAGGGLGRRPGRG